MDLTEREVLCPYCKFPVSRVFSDAKGHLRAKCPKCKGTAIVNLAYFRISKGFSKLKARYQKNRILIYIIARKRSRPF